ncbi:solute carrier family 2, facilitated glucose transporter member 10 [Elysia marginata]|uniref:Solute carrier family 2, facilitated glucose transporter member 10 n=1 Tax=Elysia marginata TaxID=1093978 RepID=A0AAV4JQM5_9GAST|nr:solute carrier family 2, facilitated glucose transporter member 10 [Elysia marginata]
MSSVKAKKRWMYVTFAIIFLFGGIEYAVILPTLWLYLHNTYNAPEFMLGLVLSAYSLAAFVSAPIFGRLSDKLHCTKKIILICCMFQMVGSFLYFIGISEWLCVASRFISGLGAAGEAVVVAEVSRFTAEKERTGIISNLIATRQVALLLGPALNLLLRLADFEIGPFAVTKYSAPGAFMVVIWALLVVIVVLLYTEPAEIYSPHEQSHTHTKSEVVDRASVNGSGGHAVSPRRYAYSQSFDLLASDDGTETVYPPLSSEKPLESYNYVDWDSSTEYHEIRSDRDAPSQPYTSGAHGGGEGSRTTASAATQKFFVSPSHSVNSDSSDYRSTEGLVYSTNGHHHQNKTRLENIVSESRDPDVEASEEFYDALTRSLPAGQVDLSSSVEILATAERLINHNQWSASQKEVHTFGSSSGRMRAQLAGTAATATESRNELFFYDKHFSLNSAEDGLYRSGTPCYGLCSVMFRILLLACFFLL